MAMSPEDKVREIVAQTIARLRELHDELPDEVRAYLADTNQNLFSSLRKRLEARDRVEVEKKLARAEKNALKVLRKLKLPTQIDGAYEDESELLFFVKKHPRYLERKGRSITALESDQRRQIQPWRYWCRCVMCGRASRKGGGSTRCVLWATSSRGLS